MDVLESVLLREVSQQKDMCHVYKISGKGHSVGMIRHSHRLRERGRKTHCFGPFTVDKSGNSVDNIHIINGINKGIQQV